MKVENFFPISYSPNNVCRRYANLAPLPFDTCSFSGREKNTGANISKSSDKKIDNSERSGNSLSQSLYRDSQDAFDILGFRLNKIFGENLIDASEKNAKNKIARRLSDSRNNSIVYISGRRKDPDSISEKMTTKHIRTKKQAKETLNDMIGARIIVSGTGQKEGNECIKKLTEGVKKGKLRITSVKMHGQENSSLNYVSKPVLENLVKTARTHGSPLCTFIDEPRDTGYLAVHVITDEIEDGYRAEIQLMGVDVVNLKDVEDLAYKCLAEKNVEKKYENIKSLFEPLKDNQDARNQYYEYAKRAYAYERKKPIHDKSKYKRFLPIPGDINLPKELDFNNIAKLKEIADKKDALSKNSVVEND